MYLIFIANKNAPNYNDLTCWFLNSHFPQKNTCKPGAPCNFPGINLIYWGLWMWNCGLSRRGHSSHYKENKCALDTFVQCWALDVSSYVSSELFFNILSFSGMTKRVLYKRLYNSLLPTPKYLHMPSRRAYRKHKCTDRLCTLPQIPKLSSFNPSLIKSTQHTSSHACKIIKNCLKIITAQHYFSILD